MLEVDDELEYIIEELFSDAELILHAGDLVSGEVLSYLGSRDVIAVAGNMDSRAVSEALPAKRIVEVGGVRIGLIHGYGSSVRLAERLRTEFDRIDCLVFGHSHQPAIDRNGNELFFNPGSVVGRGRYRPSVGLLYIGPEIQGEIIPLDSIMLGEK